MRLQSKVSPDPSHTAAVATLISSNSPACILGKTCKSQSDPTKFFNGPGKCLINYLGEGQMSGTIVSRFEVFPAIVLGTSNLALRFNASPMNCRGHLWHGAILLNSQVLDNRMSIFGI